VAVIHGAMDLRFKTALKAMTPIEKVRAASNFTCLWLRASQPFHQHFHLSLCSRCLKACHTHAFRQHSRQVAGFQLCAALPALLPPNLEALNPHPITGVHAE
jgi:hypothetical protein